MASLSLVEDVPPLNDQKPETNDPTSGNGENVKVTRTDGEIVGVSVGSPVGENDGEVGAPVGEYEI